MYCKRCGRRLKTKQAIDRGYGHTCYQLQQTSKLTTIKGWFEDGKSKNSKS
jgi:hypothetical protein